VSVVLEIFSNRVIQAAALAWAVAQGLKVILTLLISRRFDSTRFWGSGGMPSSHSAMTCAMLMVIGFHEGFASSIFALAFCFSGVVMYDASGVRRATGKNAAVINRMLELYARDHKKPVSDEELLASIQENSLNKPVKAKAKTGITVKGIHDVAVRFSRCCAPVPGDEIVGFVTRGRGVSIHRTDCINILNLSDIERDRLIDAEWQHEALEATSEKFLAEIVIYATNRSGLLADVSKALTEKNVDIQSVHTRTSKQGMATMVMTFEIRGREELNSIIAKIRGIDSVVDIERTTG